MRAGDMPLRITFQKPTVEQDSLGKQTVTWSDEITTWAGIRPVTGHEQFSADATQAEVSHVVSVRYQSLFADPKAVAAMRIIYRKRGVERIFNIHASMNMDELDFDVQLLCSEGLNTG